MNKILIFLTMLVSLSITAKEIERKDYKVTVPDVCTVDPIEDGISLDVFTTINLPDDNSFIVLVVDDEKTLKASFEGMVKNYSSKLVGAKKIKSNLFNKLKGEGVILNGNMSGFSFNFEVGKFMGKSKGYIVVSTYMESEKKEVQKLLKKIITSFKVKS